MVAPEKNELFERYKQMSQEDFEALKPENLTERAHDAYKAELGRRNRPEYKEKLKKEEEEWQRRADNANLATLKEKEERQQRADNANPATLAETKEVNDYKTSIGVALFVSFIGWVAVLAGVGLFLQLVNQGGMGLLGLPSAITVALVGLLLVIGGQASRAVMDNANYSKQMLDEMRKKA